MLPETMGGPWGDISMNAKRQALGDHSVEASMV